MQDGRQLSIKQYEKAVLHMMEFLQTMSWAAVFQIILIDILLGGDNAVVIALACRNLPAQQRVQGHLWATAGAIGVRLT